MKDNFKKAKLALRAKGITNEIVAVNGCMYGKDRNPLKKNQDPEKSYYKYADQEFWSFLSNYDNFYQEIIIPIDSEAKKKDELFKSTYAAKVNEMAQDFMRYFIANNQIDWVKLIDYVSKREEVELESATEQMVLNLKESLDEETLDLADALDIEES